MHDFEPLATVYEFVANFKMLLNYKNLNITSINNKNICIGTRKLLTFKVICNELLYPLLCNLSHGGGDGGMFIAPQNVIITSSYS